MTKQEAEEHKEVLSEAAEFLFDIDCDQFFIFATGKKGTRCFTSGKDNDLADYLRDVMAVNKSIEEIVRDALYLLERDIKAILNSRTKKDL